MGKVKQGTAKVPPAAGDGATVLGVGSGRPLDPPVRVGVGVPLPRPLRVDPVEPPR